MTTIKIFIRKRSRIEYLLFFAVFFLDFVLDFAVIVFFDVFPLLADWASDCGNFFFCINFPSFFFIVGWKTAVRLAVGRRLCQIPLRSNENSTAYARVGKRKLMLHLLTQIAHQIPLCSNESGEASYIICKILLLFFAKKTKTAPKFPVLRFF